MNICASINKKRGGLFFFKKLITIVIASLLSVTALADPLDEPAAQYKPDLPLLIMDLAEDEKMLYAVGERGIILFSDDKDVEWHQANVPVRTNLIAGFFKYPTKWVVGHEGVLLKSQDSARTWEVVMTGEEINKLQVQYYKRLLKSIHDGDEEIPDGFSLEDIEFLVEDSQNFDFEGPSRPLFDISFFDEKHGLAVGAFGLILKTNDGGQAWKIANAELPNPYSLHLNAIETFENMAFIATEQGAVFYSENKGISWKRIQSPYDGTYFGTLPISKKEIAFFGLKGNLYIHNLAEDDWSKVETNTNRSIFSIIPVGDEILISGNGALLKKTTSPNDFESGLSRSSVITNTLRVNSDSVLISGTFGIKELRLNND